MQLEPRRADRGAGHARKPKAREPLGRRLQDEARFLKSWLDNPLQAGAIAPSSPALARAMAACVDVGRMGPVVELGPGTGPVTQALVEHGVAEDRLVLVEYDPDFCKLLARRFPRATVVQGDAYAIDRTLQGHLATPAAAVVSSLPLLTRPEADRARLLLRAFGLMAPDAPFIQFTYGLTSPVPRGPGVAAEVSPPVWLNIPPARVWVYRRADDEADEAPLPSRAEPAFIRRLKAHTGRVRDELLDGADKVKLAWEIHAERVLQDERVRPTLDLLRRLNAHMEGPDTHVAADAQLRAVRRRPPHHKG
ncbi:class I SAM-dependent methyltransferase [Alsobacter soli]|uniref:class I SAM-dependent methyltransferase n=1 Tax=Alsobacter soli TaxID=2109933 RepID=UPI001AECBE2C